MSIASRATASSVSMRNEGTARSVAEPREALLRGENGATAEVDRDSVRPAGRAGESPLGCHAEKSGVERCPESTADRESRCRRKKPGALPPVFFWTRPAAERTGRSFGDCHAGIDR